MPMVRKQFKKLSKVKDVELEKDTLKLKKKNIECQKTKF